MLRNLLRKKGEKKSEQSVAFVLRLSRYYHIESVMECVKFRTATDELFFLRKRIKNKIP